MVDQASGHSEESGADGASTHEPPWGLCSPEVGYVTVEVVGERGAEQPRRVREEDTGG